MPSHDALVLVLVELEPGQQTFQSLGRLSAEGILPSSSLHLPFSSTPGCSSCCDSSCDECGFICKCRVEESVCRVKRDSESRFDKLRIAFTTAPTRISTITVMLSAGTIEFIDAGFIKLSTLLFVC